MFNIYVYKLCNSNSETSSLTMQLHSKPILSDIYWCYVYQQKGTTIGQLLDGGGLQ